MKKFVFTLMCSVLLIFSACVKPGPVGPAGKDGINGTNGVDGNANVHSYTFFSGAWTKVGNYNTVGYGFAQILAVPAINQSILDNGAVLTYMKNAGLGADYWTLTPTTYHGNGYATQFMSSIYLGGVELYVTDSDLKTTDPTQYGTIQYKVVVIGGSNKKSPLDGVDVNDYLAVCKALDIQP